MKAIIRLDIPDYQMGQEVFCYFKDSMTVKGVFERDERQKGEWIYQGDINCKLYGWFMCSNCGAVIGTKANYCSECGTDMRE